MERLCPQLPGKWEPMKHGTALSFRRGGRLPGNFVFPLCSPYAEKVHVMHECITLALTINCKLAFCWHWEEVQVKAYPSTPLTRQSVSARAPGVLNLDTSGTTISIPVKSHLSPAWADSTASALKITSKLRGILPRGSSAWVSWIRTYDRDKETAKDEKRSLSSAMWSKLNAQTLIYPKLSYQLADFWHVPTFILKNSFQFSKRLRLLENCNFTFILIKQHIFCSLCWNLL